jgi:O-antigen/teichoic acid export membrane protein
MNLLKNSLINKNIRWIGSNYFVYVLSFISSIILVKKLGPNLYGEWAIVSLIITYITQINFGITHSYYNIVITKRNNHDYSIKVLINSFVVLVLLSLFWIILYILNTYLNVINISILNSSYGYIIIFTAISSLFNALLSNYFRIENNLNILMIISIITPISIIVLSLLFKNSNLFNILIFSIMIINFSITFILFLNIKNISNINLDKLILYEIIKNGIPLFIYNTSFYFFLILIRTFYSTDSSIQEFGNFSFSISLATAVFLLIDSISFLSQTKIINLFSSFDNNRLTIFYLKRVRSSIITLNYLIVFFIILTCPLFFYFFPEYQKSEFLFKLFLMTNLILSNSSVNQYLLLAYKKLKLIATISFLILLILFVFSFTLKYFGLTGYYYLFALLIAHIIFGISLNFFSLRTIYMPKSLPISIINNFPFIPTTIYILFFIFINNNFYLFFIFILFVYLERKNIYKIFTIIRNIILNPNYFSISK